MKSKLAEVRYMLNGLLSHQITQSTALDRAVCGRVVVESRDETLIMRI